MTKTLRHRGPDDGNHWVDLPSGIGFGHRRLSVLDLSAHGSQPMHSRSGRFVVAHNGELYNHPEMRDELAARGARFRGTSDTETLLEAVEAWGIETAIQRSNGMFAFALWDCRERELHLVRDRLGIKPLYWGNFGDLFIFGSELKALTACKGWQPTVSLDALASYGRWNYVPSPSCIYAGVSKLAPGTWLTVRGGETPTVRRYWDYRSIAASGVAAPLDISDMEATDQLHALLRDSVRGQLLSDVPLGAFLSGGTDSSLVVALMQETGGATAKSFSIGFEDAAYNEAPHARLVAERLGTQHTEVILQPRDALEVIPRLPEIYDEPFADSSQVPTTLVSELARRYVTVALSGDGGDEMFAGYTRYHWADMVRRRFHRHPALLRRGLAASIEAVPSWVWEAAAAALPGGVRPHRAAIRAGKLAAFLREPDADAVYRRQHTHWTNPAHLVPGGQEIIGVPFDPRLKQEIPNFLRRMQLLDTLTYLPDDILTKVDRASMSVGLEVRVPLLDHRVVEFACGLPDNMMIRGRSNKWLLRQVLYRYLPRELMDRKKMGFSIPLGTWLRGPLREWAESLLDANRISEGGFFDARLVRGAWASFVSGRSSDQEPLWAILMFEAWRDAVGPAYARHP